MTIRPPTSEEYRDTVGLFTTGVTVVSTCHDDVLHGMTANAFASVSLDPLLVLVCVDRDAGMHALLPESRSFVVSILASGQEKESIWFASSERRSGADQFDEVEWEPAPVTGCPIVAGNVAWLDCRLAQMHEAGDHTIFIGEVLAVGRGEGEAPLVFYRGDYRGLQPSGSPGRPG